jgi:hypothetical protein
LQDEGVVVVIFKDVRNILTVTHRNHVCPLPGTTVRLLKHETTLFMQTNILRMLQDVSDAMFPSGRS